MKIETVHIKCFADEMAKIAEVDQEGQEYQDPQEYQEVQNPPAKAPYKYKPWHTIPAGLGVGALYRGLGKIEEGAERSKALKSAKAMRATSAQQRVMRMADPKAYLRANKKSLPFLFTKSRAAGVFRKMRSQGAQARAAAGKVLTEMISKNKKMALALGSAMAVGGPAVSIASKLIERKRQAAYQNQQ